MLTKNVEKALNDQLVVELQSAYEYLSMAAYCESISLPGMAGWLHKQWEEELQHAMKFFNFIHDRDGRVELAELKKPRIEYKSTLEVFETALEHERHVTRSIHDLYRLVEEEKDYASQAWLDWFATEQVEEEKNVGHIVDQLKRAGDRGEALFFLDKELGSRGPE